MAANPLAPVAQQLSNLYFYATMDVIVDVAEALAKDLRQNPQRYRRLDQQAVQDLAGFARLGTDPNWPDRGERAQLAASYLGMSDARQQVKDPTEEGFAGFGRHLRRAAYDYANQAPNAPAAPLQQALVDAGTDLFDYLQNKQGVGLNIHQGQLGAIFNVAVNILTNPTLAPVFGKVPPAAGWPRTRGDPLGLELVQEIASQLKDKLDHESKDLLARFSNLQRMAYDGTQTIEFVVLQHNAWSVVPSNEFDTLVRHSYAWYGSVKKGNRQEA